ncbi:Rieske (2Fe-2S) protein [Streptomyces sodiiphilus]|uniref:Cytochrome bc1 complex Rieske iron-sulfur subunit n=1 Tax=Streptomyces sodiiphilus TaxID=226217 RepID=A0ABP5B5X6_9ACTN
MSTAPRTSGPASRRSVVTAMGALGLTGALVACGEGNGNGGEEGEATPEAPGNDVLTTVSEVPEGGGIILEEHKVVVTQPEPGDFRAFSAVCTHRGCLVSDVSGGTINCACHGSSFAIEDGSVTGGPATSPLPEEALTVEGDELRLG